jgi:hypothetical protein
VTRSTIAPRVSVVIPLNVGSSVCSVRCSTSQWRTVAPSRRHLDASARGEVDAAIRAGKPPHFARPAGLAPEIAADAWYGQCFGEAVKEVRDDKTT